MRREFPQSIASLFRDPFLAFDVRNYHKDNGGGIVCALPGNKADQAGTSQ
jgi:hypothetical protein